jgi:hypothetical protein
MSPADPDDDNFGFSSFSETKQNFRDDGNEQLRRTKEDQLAVKQQITSSFKK